jgi:hypothetical protein
VYCGRPECAVAGLSVLWHAGVCCGRPVCAVAGRCVLWQAGRSVLSGRQAGMCCGRPRLTTARYEPSLPAVCKALPWLRLAVAGLLPKFGPGRPAGPVLANFVLDTVALSLSFHHCSVFSCIYILLLPEGQIGEA